jgi:hypothetical protein
MVLGSYYPVCSFLWTNDLLPEKIAMDTLIKYFGQLLQCLSGWYYSGYGDPSESHCLTLPIPIGSTIWIPLVTMSYPCILYIRNLSIDPAQWFEFTWNKDENFGAYIGPSEGFVFDRVLGTLYVRPGDPSKACIINASTVALKHTDQSV